MGARLHPSSKGGRGTREDARRTAEGVGTAGAISNLRRRDASVQFTERGRIASALHRHLATEGHANLLGAASNAGGGGAARKHGGGAAGQRAACNVRDLQYTWPSPDTRVTPHHRWAM